MRNREVVKAKIKSNFLQFLTVRIRCLKDKEPWLEDVARCFGQQLRTNRNPHHRIGDGKVVVCFLGGVTMAECAALDLLSRQLGRSIVVAATDTISGPALIDSLMVDE